MQYQIINTCGTSVLTKPSRQSDLFTELLKYSNAKTEKDIPVDIYNRFDNLWKKLIDEFKNLSEKDARDASAELNSLLTWQRKNSVKNQDCYCYLVHTDTVFGYMAASLVEEWLNSHKYQGVFVKKIESLNTNSLNSFEDGLSNLVKWFSEIKNNFYGDSIIFNTAGGFKAVSGFAQVLGTFWADKTIYKFETGDEILEIPKLPIVWSEIDTIQKNFDTYRKISLSIPLDSYAGLNPLWIKNGKFTPWGQIAWENAKEVLYGTQVFPFVYDGVVEGKEFRNSVKDLDANCIAHINERIDDLCLFKLSNGDYNPRRLDYKSLKVKQQFSHECDAWAFHGAKRLFCNEEDGKIIVEKLDKGLH